jgi:hypothetical protein
MLHKVHTVCRILMKCVVQLINITGGTIQHGTCSKYYKVEANLV